MLQGKIQMAAPKYNLVLISSFLISVCAHSGGTDILIDNQVKSCFTVAGQNLHHGEALALNIKLGPSEKTHTCSCKAALYTYAAYQNNDGTRNNLIEGVFTSLNKERIRLPLAVQTQLIYKFEPLTVTFSCAQP